jgi:SpoVK/Ycf46/Vps4 family AAA+-type ATPase
MLRDHLTDAAIAAAKAWSHPDVEPRHLGYAIARHLEDRPEAAELLPRAKAALEPIGSAISTPEPTEDTNRILSRIESEDDAMVVLRGLLDGSIGPGGPDGALAPTVEGEETLADVLAELDGLIGLDSVKAQVRRVVAVVQANQERAEAGLSTVNPGLHLVLTGAPGTGKTTVARIIARLYAASGALPGSNFTEATRSDLVAGYVGQTAIKTDQLIDQTLPGVLFVDEAYSLTPSHASDFGAEAIATLVKAMEDHRDRLAVIVAGYREEMTAFVESNPGLRSRLRTFIDFPDYSPAELVRIFHGLAESNRLHLSPEALERAGDLFHQAVDRPDFGNARLARSLFERAYARMAVRAAEDQTVHVDELKELIAADLEWDEREVSGEIGRIGFSSPDPRDEENGPEQAS